MIAADVRGGMNASGARTRMCLSTLPSRSATSAKRPNAARCDVVDPGARPGFLFERWLGLGLIQDSLDEGELLDAKLRRATGAVEAVARIVARTPGVRILERADSGCARD
jgi:hypothetical protein